MSMQKMDGYDDCIVGVIERCNQPDILCYDLTRVIKKLMADGMTEEEALEFWSFNQLGAWVGDTTPCFLRPVYEGEAVMSELNGHIVLYRSKHCAPCDPPLGFRCYAKDSDHAEEQCLDAEPGADVVWVVETESYPVAMDDYFGVTEENE